MAQAAGLGDEALRRRILAYVRHSHARGEAPSVRGIGRGLKVSMRRLYRLFPRGLGQIYAEAGLPADEARGRLALTEGALRARGRRASGNELTAQIFERLDRGEGLTRIAIELRADPDAVREAYEKWVSLKEVDVNQPKVLRRLREIEGRLAILEGFMGWIGMSVDRRLRDDHNGCKYMSGDGYCAAWHWYEPVDGCEMRPGIVEEGGRPRTVYWLNVKRHKFICAACPSYSPRGTAWQGSR
jgi:hypothetical protein